MKANIYKKKILKRLRNVAYKIIAYTRKCHCPENEVFIEVSYKDFFSQYKQIRNFLWICSYLQRKSYIAYLIFLGNVENQHS